MLQLLACVTCLKNTFCVFAGFLRMLLLPRTFALLVFLLSCLRLQEYAESKLPQEEVDALKEIISTMGATYWEFDSDSCEIKMLGLMPEPPKGSQSSIGCDCSFENSTCHVVNITIKWYSLPGMLPPQLVKLPYLTKIDFALNYLNGTIPKEWSSMKLTSLSLFVNRVSGEIPKELGSITTLTYLNLEANQFYGLVPPELGNLFNLQTLILSSNRLSGHLPVTFAQLQNLTDFRISDNSFNGKIPSFIQNWKLLQRLEMLGSGLEGPIPSNISLLRNLSQLSISDINGPSQNFPILNMTGMVMLILRNCNITGELPSYFWTIKSLETLDVSFNKLVGKLPVTAHVGHLRFLFLTGNMLSGNVPDSILMGGSSVDLSYNNFTWPGPEQPTCGESLNLNLNLFRSSLGTNALQGFLPCLKTFSCPRYSHCLHVNCGGKNVKVMENDENILYLGDENVLGGAAKYYNDHENYWGFSSTGDFMDDGDYLNSRYTRSLPSSNLPELYKTARVAPISLTYFHYCLENGKYTVNLHFAEIQFTNDNTYSSLGKRLFDIYVQGSLYRKDFNIEDKAHIAQKPYVILSIHNVTVTDNILEIRFYWAGKGTRKVPVAGVYGPLISAFSFVSDSKPCSDQYNARQKIIIGLGFGVTALCIVFIMVGIFWWKGYMKGIIRRKKGTEGQDSQKGTFTLKQIQAATDNFSPANKIGEGGFGPVYKGQLSDGTWVAVKQLSSNSRQGNREFLNEIGMISCLQHPNLVKLNGCCIEGDQLMLVYEYMENNCLARALFSSNYQLKLDWPTRLRICTGIAKGLAFLHEESRLKIVHRDIKATNVLLDGNLNPKISDFGLARLDQEEKTHISTRVAGTIGYMAPEYALWGYLTYKVDVYSFGVVVLETVSGKSNNNYIASDNCFCLLDKACHLQKIENLIELVDERLESEVNPTEAINLMKVALLCTNASPSLRPTMSEVVNMLEGRMSIPDDIPEPSSSSEDLRFKAMRDIHQLKENHS